MQEKRGLFRILWEHLVGETSRQIKSGGFTGILEFIVVGGSRLVFTSLGDKWNRFGQLAEFFARPAARAFSGAWHEWQYGAYEAHSTESGLTVLKRPKPIVPERARLVVPKTLAVPKTLVVPSSKLILPPKDLLLFNKSRGAALETPYNALRPRRPSVGPRSSFFTDVEYPQWMLRDRFESRARPTVDLNRGDTKQYKPALSFADWYVENSGGDGRFGLPVTKPPTSSRLTERIRTRTQTAKRWDLNNMNRDGFGALEQEAKDGNTQAQFHLGKMLFTGRYFHDGFFVVQDKRRARTLLATAASRGSKQAREYLRRNGLD